MKCLECVDGRALFDDPRSPPLSTKSCLCRDCYIMVLEETETEQEIDLAETQARLQRLRCGNAIQK